MFITQNPFRGKRLLHEIEEEEKDLNSNKKKLKIAFLN
jgi:hypothetical protein